VSWICWGANPARERSLDLPVAGGVNVQSEGAEHAEDPALGLAFIA
jgi:hypothetical protein